MSTPETTFKKAPVTLGRVTKYYQLLDELGISDSLSKAAEHEGPSMKPESPGEALQRRKGADTVTVNLGQIFKAIATAGALMRLGSIVYECSEEDAETMTFEALEVGFIPFARASTKLLSMLIGFGGGSEPSGDGQATSPATPSISIGEA